MLKQKVSRTLEKAGKKVHNNFKKQLVIDKHNVKRNLYSVNNIAVD